MSRIYMTATWMVQQEDGEFKKMVQGVRRKIVAPYSEVCMHMGIAGTEVEAEVRVHTYRNGNQYYGVQLYRDNQPLGGGVTMGEAGIRIEEKNGFEYFYSNQTTPDENPREVIRELTNLLETAVSGSNVKVITNLGL